MKKIWINKPKTFKEAEEFDQNYYLNMSPGKRLDIMQYLRDSYFKIKGYRYANRERLQRFIKIIQ